MCNDALGMQEGRKDIRLDSKEGTEKRTGTTTTQVGVDGRWQ